MVIVGSEKGGIKKRKKEGEEGEGGEGVEGTESPVKKIKNEDDENVLKCFGCKRVFRTLVELRAHLAAYER